MGVLEYGIRGDVAELYKKRPKEDTRVKAGGQKRLEVGPEEKYYDI